MGILKDDPRVKKVYDFMEELESDEMTLDQLTKALNYKGVKTNPHIEFLVRVMTSDMLIAEFPQFKQTVEGLFAQCQKNKNGKPADYIPELAKGPPNNWGVSVCTVEGQRL